MFVYSDVYSTMSSRSFPSQISLFHIHNHHYRVYICIYMCMYACECVYIINTYIYNYT